MIRAIAIWLLASTLLQAQYLVEQPPENLAQAIGQGAAKSVADLEARIATLEQLVPPYVPTWTWPGHDTPNAFDRLRVHMAGEKVHPARNVAKWSRAELAFTHDKDHVEEYLAQGRALPVLKDQRLRDWLRAKSPAKALPKKLGWQVKRIVMHTKVRCPACDTWKQDSLPAALADGVEVAIVDEGRGISGQSYPYFDVEYCSENACQRMQFVNEPYTTMKNRLMRMNN